jgi:hypothetical protein
MQNPSLLGNAFAQKVFQRYQNASGSDWLETQLQE